MRRCSDVSNGHAEHRLLESPSGTTTCTTSTLLDTARPQPQHLERLRGADALAAEGDVGACVWRELTLDEAGALRGCDKALRATLPNAAEHGHGRIRLMVWWSSATAEQLRRYELRRLAYAFERLLRALGEDPVLFQSAIANHGALPSRGAGSVSAAA